MSEEYILVVDDDWMNREVIEAYLTSDGYTVKSVGNGQHAIEIAEKHPPALVLLDVNMPGMNGHEVARRLRQMDSTKDTPIVMVTASSNPQDRLLSIAAGCNGYITKPINVDCISNQVAAFL